MSITSPQILELAALITSALTFVGVVALIFRSPKPVQGLTDIKSDIERLERTIQSNDSRSFTNAENRGDALRKEVADNIKGFADQLSDSLKLVGDGQKQQLEAFGTSLSTSTAALDARLASAVEQQQRTLTEFVAANAENGRALRDEIAGRLKAATDELRAASESSAVLQKERLDELATRLTSLSDSLGQKFQEFRTTTEAGLGELRKETSEALKSMRSDNEQKLEQIRATVDEKLQGTLEKRLGESFSLVSQQLKQVHEGLGDMQKLATGVGDLKRVLTNVKSRGTWGETQLAAVLEDMLGPDQYARNVKVKDGSNETVEFYVKIPTMGEQDAPVLLPIDAKFPVEDYERMLACAESGDIAGSEQAAQKLEARFRASAKDISTKYISSPVTTEYAVLYVPSEGLYAEIVKRPGVVSAITREFNVVLAGPTNLMSILNAVQAVTRSVTIQQKAGQIASLLLKVQSEFQKYGEAVSVAKKRAESTVKAMESLDQRQRVMGKTLRAVKSIETGGETAVLQADSVDILSLPLVTDAEDEDLDNISAKEAE
jgi:DNA recombination protein RmuC